ncbi:hypothetical protein E05_47100 [Plautia stali symbiont]|nr:hypothetical protein E05_47100 [Plautia stali symbiont]
MQPGSKRLQILTIGRQRILRQVALSPERVEKLFYQIAVLHCCPSPCEIVLIMPETGLLLVQLRQSEFQSEH